MCVWNQVQKINKHERYVSYVLTTVLHNRLGQLIVYKKSEGYITEVHLYKIPNCKIRMNSGKYLGGIEQQEENLGSFEDFPTELSKETFLRKVVQAV